MKVFIITYEFKGEKKSQSYNSAGKCLNDAVKKFRTSGVTNLKIINQGGSK